MFNVTYGSRVGAAALVISFLLPGLHNAANANDTFVLKADNKFLTLQANNANLEDVFAELENQTGIRISFEAPSAEKVTFDMQQQPFLAAIERLAPNHLVINGKTNGQVIIKELIILGDDANQQSNTGGFENLPTGEPADEIIDDTAMENLPIENDTTTENMAPEDIPNPDPNAPALQN